MSNLHLFSDSLGYYTNQTINKCEELDTGVKNYYFNFTPTVKYPNHKSELADRHSRIFKDKIKGIDKISRIFIHFNTTGKLNFVKEYKRYNPNVIVFWVFWSADFYNLPEYFPSLLQPYSRKFFEYENRYKAFIYPVYRFLRFHLTKDYYSLKSYFSNFKLIDHFASLLKQDYLNVKTKSKASFTHLPFAYLSLGQMLDPSMLEGDLRKDVIMLGHCASIESNHFEVIQALEKLDLTNEILVNFSYGNKKYANKLYEDKIKRSSLNIKVQWDFVEKNEYYQNMRKFGFAIFNFTIQQAIGNIIALVYIGTKVFLPEENPVYKEFKEWGLHVYSTDSDLNIVELTNLLGDKEVKENRDIIVARTNNELVNSYWRKMLTMN